MLKSRHTRFNSGILEISLQNGVLSNMGKLQGKSNNLLKQHKFDTIFRTVICVAEYHYGHVQAALKSFEEDF